MSADWYRRRYGADERNADMAVIVEIRKEFLNYRLRHDGDEWREAGRWRNTTRNKATMEKRARRMSEEMAEGTFDYLRWFPDGNRVVRYRPAPPPAPEPLPTLAEYFERWLTRKAAAPTTRKTTLTTYKKHWRAHIARPWKRLDKDGKVAVVAFGGMRLDEVFTIRALPFLRDFQTVLWGAGPDQKGLSEGTARNVIDATFRSIRKGAVQDYPERITGNCPFAALEWPKKAEPEPDPFTGEERDRLCDWFWHKNRHYFPFVYTAFHTGMRPSELVGLKWGCVDLATGKLTVKVSRTEGQDNPVKTKKSKRTRVAQESVCAVLRAIQPLHCAPDTHVFTTRYGTPIQQEKFMEKHWHRALRATGIRPRRFQQARSTFITEAIRRGLDLKFIADYCGTSVTMIEKHYAGELTAAEQRAQLARLGGDSGASQEAM
jgi:integrase